MNDGVEGESFDIGDRVRIDIPDETHPDHSHHGTNGQIIAEIPASDSSSSVEKQNGWRFRVELDVGGVVDVRPHNVRPPI